MNPLFLNMLCALCVMGAWSHAEDISTSTPAALEVSSGVLVPSATPPPMAREPYHCPLSKCVVVSGYGARTIPGKTITERNEGVNFRVTPGQTVHAARSGRVIFAGFSKAYASRANKHDQERLVIIHHADGQSSRYVHLNSLAVRPPQAIKAGDKIGTASESDEWSEPVLHFEIRSAGGAPINPEKFIKAEKK